MAHRVSPLLRKRVALRVAKLFINQNMNRILIKHLGWQLYLSCIASEKDGPTFYMFGSCEVWLLIHTLRTLVFSLFFLLQTFSITWYLQKRFFLNKTSSSNSPRWSRRMITFRSTPPPTLLPPRPIHSKKKREAGVTDKAPAMTCYRYFRLS